MRILFLSHYFPPEGNAPASRTYESCKRWVAEGHEVTVITCAPNVPDGVVYDGYKNTLRPQRETIDGIEVIRVWTYIAPHKGTVRRIMNHVSYMLSSVWTAFWRKRPDIIISSSPQFFCGWAGLLSKWLLRRPQILEIRDIWPDTIETIGAMQNKRVLRFIGFLETRMYRGATHIVTVGNGYRKILIEEKGVPEDKLSVVTNGTNLEMYEPRPTNDALKREIGAEGCFVVSYIGTIGMCSGLEFIPRAAQNLKDRGLETFRICLIGDGAVREEIEQEVKRLGLDNVIFTGRQPKNRMPDFLAMTDACLVHLKKRDLFKTVLPSKIFEACAMERPIIIGVQGEAGNLIRKADAGICIEPENAKELVDAMQALANDPKQARAYGKSGRSYISKHFNMDYLAKRYLQILRDVAAGQQPAPDGEDGA